MPPVAQDAYPRPRTRPGASGLETGGGAALHTPVPLARLWPFYLRETGGLACAVSPSFVGPLVVDEILVTLSGAGGAPNPTFDLLFSEDNGGGGNNQAVSTIISGTPLFEGIDRRDDTAAAQTRAAALTLTNYALTAGQHRWPIRRYLTLSRVYLKAILVSEVGFDNSIFGYVRVLEGVPPDLAPNFS